MRNFLSSFEAPVRAVVLGASGGIGHAFTEHLLAQETIEHVYAFARSPLAMVHEKCSTGKIDYADEATISAAAQQVKNPNIVIVATGMLHDGDTVRPEKSLKDLNADKFSANFAINTVGPALVAKHFVPLLPRDQRGVFAALSARVGSISDNRLGGWHAYRASKAALNMLIRCAAIETARKYPHAVIVGLHPGTVDTALSKPFQSNVKPQSLSKPVDAAANLLQVMDQLRPLDSGKCFDWAGHEVPT